MADDEPRYLSPADRLQELARDPRQLDAAVSAFADMAFNQLATAREDLLNATNLNALIRELMVDQKTRRLATDIGDLKSRHGKERIDRLHKLYATRNEALGNVRRQVREGVYIMGEAAKFIDLARRVAVATGQAPEAPVDAETQQAIENAAARLNRLRIRRVNREVKRIDEKIGSMIVEPPKQATA